MKPLHIANHTFDWGARTYVMGILNVTPDSFSGDGLLPSTDPTREREGTEAAVEQARSFLASGADILDVGGESTRPGSEPVDAKAEMARVIPVIQALSKEFPGALISIDTYKSAVAEAAFQAGAHLLNDVWALRADPALAGVAAKYNAPVILMHNRSNPANVEVRRQLGGAYIGAEYDDLIEDVRRELMDSVRLAEQAGIESGRVILDPGIGFGKTLEQNLELIGSLAALKEALDGMPMLVGLSRKSFIGKVLGDVPVSHRLNGTIASNAIALMNGADIIRVHDVRPNRDLIDIYAAICRSDLEHEK